MSCERQEAFKNALKDKTRGMGLRKAAKKWGVSVSGLWKRVHGQIKYERRGRREVLSLIEEERFEQWIIERCNSGVGVSKGEFLDSVKTFLDKEQRDTRLTNNRPGHMWYRGFLARHPRVKLKRVNGVYFLSQNDAATAHDCLSLNSVNEKAMKQADTICTDEQSSLQPLAANNIKQEPLENASSTSVQLEYQMEVNYDLSDIQLATFKTEVVHIPNQKDLLQISLP